jgi:RNA polymerase sigma-70 factor (ECF subfamily)
VTQAGYNIVSFDTFETTTPAAQAPPPDLVPAVEAARPAVPDAPEELMRRVQKGDMHAYQEIIRRYRNRVYRVIRTYLHDPEDAMEALQDTFFKVYSRRRTWKSRYSYAGWIYRIAINTSIDRMRRSSRQRTSSLEELMEGRRVDLVPASPVRGPLDRLQDGERRRLLEKAVLRLPARQREVVALRYFAEMTLDEIATAIHCPLGTVKSNLHKAVTGLKEMLLRRKGVVSHE